MTAIKNLWSEDILQESNAHLPFTILQEQASYFNQMTKNVLVAKVVTRAALATSTIDGYTGTLSQHLVITAPAIGSYEFILLRVNQDPLSLYPTKIYSPILEKDFVANNAEELENVLADVFRDKKTISTIQSLIAQSRN
jgi:hypothetical protein